MMSRRSFGRYRQTGMCLLPLLALLMPAVVHAQDTTSPADSLAAPPPTQGTVGPPQLRNFDLQGSKIVPVKPQTTPPTINVPLPRVSTPEPALPAQTRQPAPTETRPAEPPTPTAKRTAPAAQPAAPAVMPKSEAVPAGPPVEE